MNIKANKKEEKIAEITSRTHRQAAGKSENDAKI